jgi:hypothetical protein
VDRRRWILGGDLNIILFFGGKGGESEDWTGIVRGLQKVIDDLHLID